MKYYKDVHVVLEETEFYYDGDGIRVTLDTSDDVERVDYDITIDAVLDAGYSGYACTMSLRDLFYKIKDIIPYEWIADIKEGNKNDK